jgi:SAM-dependent methyltransferase
MTHFDNLLKMIPDLSQKRILDLGAGKGGFLLDLAGRGLKAVGIEYNPDYIDEALRLANEKGLNIEIERGDGESLPFGDSSFDFINMSEVFEHVHDPRKVMQEVSRTLSKGGEAYISIPNRYGLIDPHYHLVFINWMPRVVAEWIISLFGKNKDDSGCAGVQRLSDMHYRSYQNAIKELNDYGFEVSDVREIKIQKIYSGIKLILARFAYLFASRVYFDSMHFLIKK